MAAAATAPIDRYGEDSGRP